MKTQRSPEGQLTCLLFFQGQGPPIPLLPLFQAVQFRHAIGRLGRRGHFDFRCIAVMNEARADGETREGAPSRLVQARDIRVFYASGEIPRNTCL